jgi:hypothetical protein
VGLAGDARLNRGVNLPYETVNPIRSAEGFGRYLRLHAVSRFRSAENARRLFIGALTRLFTGLSARDVEIGVPFRHRRT